MGYCDRSLQQLVEPAGEKAAQMIAPTTISGWQQTAVQQMASGVSHLHRHGVAHQCLGPSTVRVCDSGHLLICSLQHAWCAEFPQSPATVAWAAAADCGRDPFKADVFALGALAHYVLTGGAHPFGKRSVRAARISQGKSSLSLLKGTPLAADFVAAAVSHNAVDRPSAAICEDHPMLWSAATQAALIFEASDQMDAADVACNLETRIEAAARRIFVKDRSGRLEPRCNRICSRDEGIDLHQHETCCELCEIRFGIASPYLLKPQSNPLWRECLGTLLTSTQGW